MPNLGSGLSAQLGVKKETTWGTPVTVDRFWEIEPEAAFETEMVYPLDNTPLLGRGMHQRSDRARSVKVGAKSKFNFVPMTKGYGLLFQMLLGTAAIAQVGATAEWKQTFTPDTVNGMRGLGATAQLNIPSSDGNDRPFTGEGGKISKWKLIAALDEPLKLQTEWLFEDVVTSTALATASYPTGAEPWTFNEILIDVFGTATPLKSVEIEGVNGIAENRRALRSSALRREPLANARWPINISLEGEFEDLTAYNAWIAGTQGALILTATGANIPTTSAPYKLVVTIPAMVYRGENPKVESEDIIMMPRKAIALKNAADPIIKIEYHSDDTAA
jgi:hypothetical protein